MRKRFEEFSLSLNPEKTRLIEFGRFAAEIVETTDVRDVGPSDIHRLVSFGSEGARRLWRS